MTEMGQLDTTKIYEDFCACLSAGCTKLYLPKLVNKCCTKWSNREMETNKKSYMKEKIKLPQNLLN